MLVTNGFTNMFGTIKSKVVSFLNTFVVVKRIGNLVETVITAAKYPIN